MSPVKDCPNRLRYSRRCNGNISPRGLGRSDSINREGGSGGLDTEEGVEISLVAGDGMRG